MTMIRLICGAALLASTSLALGACTDSPSSQSGATAVPTAVAKTAPNAGTKAAAALPHVVVHKSPSCGCCGVWVEHLRQAGFTVAVENQDNLNPIKERLGVPHGKGSCHTAEVGGYVVEGHVPAGDIKRLLAEKPDAKGLTLPGMPMGSPGMEMPDGRAEPYTVELIGRDGGTTAFASH